MDLNIFQIKRTLKESKRVCGSGLTWKDADFCPPPTSRGTCLKTSRHLVSMQLVDKEQAAEWPRHRGQRAGPLTVMGGGEEVSARHVQHQETHKILSGRKLYCAGE